MERGGEKERSRSFNFAKLFYSTPTQPQRHLTQISHTHSNEIYQKEILKRNLFVDELFSLFPSISLPCIMIIVVLSGVEDNTLLVIVKVDPTGREALHFWRSSARLGSSKIFSKAVNRLM